MRARRLGQLIGGAVLVAATSVGATLGFAPAAAADAAWDSVPDDAAWDSVPDDAAWDSVPDDAAWD
jgi:hypothetical protein